jgi:hypothetical protein
LFAVVVPDKVGFSNETNFNFFLTTNYAVINIGIDIYFTKFEKIKNIEEISTDIDFKRIETF